MRPIIMPHARIKRAAVAGPPLHNVDPLAAPAPQPEKQLRDEEPRARKEKMPAPRDEVLMKLEEPPPQNFEDFNGLFDEVIEPIFPQPQQPQLQPQQQLQAQIPLAPPPPPFVVIGPVPVVAAAAAAVPAVRGPLDLKPQADETAYVEYVPRGDVFTLSAATKAIPSVGNLPYGGLLVSKQHLNKPIKQLYEDAALLEQLRDIDSRELMQYVNDPKWAEPMKEALIHACDYSGNQAFQTVAAMQPNLKALTDYAESDVETMGAGMKGKASPDIRAKLRFVTKALRDSPGALGVVVMLANHGGVCHVMKEVGIRAAYGALASSRRDVDSTDVGNSILELLHDLRELLVEKLYIAQELNGAKQSRGAPVVNTHNVITYRNGMFPYIGLAKIPDPNVSDSTIAHRMIPTFFERFYTTECILEHISNCLADRKLSYNATVSFLKYNRPAKFQNDPEEFLYNCFDETTGKFTKGCVAWLLYKVGVLTDKYVIQEPPKRVVEDLGHKSRVTVTTVTIEGKEPDLAFLFPPMTADQLSRSRDVLAKSLHEELQQEKKPDNNKLLSESVDDLMLTLSFMHVCDGNCKHE